MWPISYCCFWLSFVHAPAPKAQGPEPSSAVCLPLKRWEAKSGRPEQSAGRSLPSKQEWSNRGEDAQRPCKIPSWSRHGFRYIWPMYGLTGSLIMQFACPGKRVPWSYSSLPRLPTAENLTLHPGRRKSPCCSGFVARHRRTLTVAVAVARPNLRWKMVPYHGGIRREAPYLCVMPVSGDFTTACDIWLAAEGPRAYTVGTRGRWGQAVRPENLSWVAVVSARKRREYVLGYYKSTETPKHLQV
jgi:hypothetical protein